jgi:cytochrome c oxidase cbb3-type subunit 3
MRFHFREAIAVTLMTAGVVGCTREHRELSDEPPATGPTVGRVERASDMAGLTTAQFDRKYQGNAYAMSQGKHLFEWFNCVGCHAHGGGSIGPALMDADWIYGSDPHSIYQTIQDGRPNGMPAFRGRISQTQAWQLVAYVRSLSGQASKAASPSRSDSLQVKEAEQSQPRQPPQPGVPASAEHQ